MKAEHVYIEEGNLDSPGVGSRDVPDTGSPRTRVCCTVLVLDRAIDAASGNVTIQGKTDAGALVVVNGRQSRASAAGAFSASFPLAGTATIAVVSTSRPGFSMLLSLPAIPSVARHVLPVMTFSYDGTSRTLGLAGKLTHGSPRMTVDGVVKAIDAQGTKPLISHGTTMVPIRAIVESLGGSVGWDAAARCLDIRLGSRTVTTWAGPTGR